MPTFRLRETAMPLKQIVGHIVSCYLNGRLAGSPDRAELARIVDLANRHPNWLAAVATAVRVPTNFGFDITCDRRSGIGQTLIADGEWEGLLSRTILACLQPGDTAIDIGANIGYDTLLMSHAVGPNGLVFAFDPEPENFSMLLRNICDAPHGNVVPISLGAAESLMLGNISVTDAYYRGHPNMRPDQAGRTRKVIATRLDQLVTLPPDAHIALVKIDIEGFEYGAIRGMGALIDKVSVLTCEINHRFLDQCGSSAAEIFSYMQARGFTSYCGVSQSDTQWQAADHGYQISDKQTHFDAMFCREIPERLHGLIA